MGNLVAFVVATSLVASFMLCRFFYTYRLARSQFPGPPVRNFWVGNLDQVMADDVHKKWLQWNREYGQIFQTWNGPFSRVIYIGNPRIVATIATANWPKSAAQYEGFRPLDGDALFLQTDLKKWRIQSKRLAPAFQPLVIQAQYPCLKKHLENYIQHLDHAAQAGDVVDLASLHVLVTLDIIGDIAFGAELHAISQGPGCLILRLFDEILPELMKCGLFPLRAKIPIFQKTRDMHRAIRQIRSIAKNSIAHARCGGEYDEKGQARKVEQKIFEILATQKEPDGNYTFSEKELCDDYIAFLVAGGDPTAHTMSFAIYQVLRHPEVYAKLRAEIYDSIPDDTVIPTLGQIQLPYLGMVIKETLRYSSPGFGTFRECPVATEVAGVTLPEKTTLALWNPGVHRDPRLWDDPDTFDPERWRSGESRVAGSYFPFSYGPRSCVGKGLAMLEMTLVLATVFRRYDLSLEPGFEMEYMPSFTLKPKNGLPVRLKLNTTSVR
ncbi:cytochrome P450 46A1 [Xylaria arbuscula]|nr:cytochrome P450 46A1 [Xylaria arbuscula]